jgi:soluble lytic murein transglycosylase
MFRKILILLFAVIVIGALATIGAIYYRINRYDKLISEVSPKYQLEPELGKAVIYEESFFDAEAHSSQNAIGLMQVTAIAVQEWVDSTHASNFSEALAKVTKQDNLNRKPQQEEALTNPEVNLHIGCWYLQNLLSRYKSRPASLAVALAAYNAGPTNVDRWASDTDLAKLSQADFIEEIEFPVTRNYVQKIIKRYQTYKQDQTFSK